MNNIREMEEVAELLPMVCSFGELPLACQQAIEFQRLGNWEAALRLVDQECYSPTTSDARAQAMAVEGSIRLARNELKQALRCYQLACDDFRLRRNAVGEAAMYIAIGMVHEVAYKSEELTVDEKSLHDAQIAYQEARTRFQEICGQPIDQDDTRIRNWCRTAMPILDAHLEFVRPKHGVPYKRSPRWIPRLETSAAGTPMRYAFQEWEQIRYKSTGQIQVEDIAYELQPVSQKVQRPIYIDPAMEYFITKAQGVSMIDAGIRDGDLLLVRRQTWSDTGQIAVVELEADGGQVSLVKRFRYDDRYVYLESANPAYKTRTFRREAPGLRILGTVLAVLKEAQANDSET